jgi:hypothetical protein
MSENLSQLVETWGEDASGVLSMHELYVTLLQMQRNTQMVDKKVKEIVKLSLALSHGEELDSQEFLISTGSLAVSWLNCKNVAHTLFGNGLLSTLAPEEQEG